MSKRKAVTTSKKRVEAILRTREREIRSTERAWAERRVREEYTQRYTIDPRSYSREPILLNPVPTKPTLIFNIPTSPGGYGRVKEFGQMTHMDDLRVRQVMFEAERKAWTDGQGNVFIWHDWRVRG